MALWQLYGWPDKSVAGLPTSISNRRIVCHPETRSAFRAGSKRTPPRAKITDVGAADAAPHDPALLPSSMKAGLRNRVLSGDDVGRAEAIDQRR